MRLVRTQTDLLEFRGRDGLGAPALVGGALLVGPASIALFADAPLTSVRILMVLVLALLALGLLRLGWARRHRVRISVKDRTIQVDGGLPSGLGDDPVLRLVAAPSIHATGPSRYGVCLERPGNEPVLVLASSDPARALDDASVVRRVLAVPVSTGWGLPATAPPWVDVRRNVPSENEAPPNPGHSTEPPSPRRIATMLLVGSAVVGLLLANEFSTRIALGDTASRMSIILPVLATGMLLLVAAGFGTSEIRVRARDDLSCERRIWGVRYARRSIPFRAIHRAYFVTPSQAPPSHILLDTDDGAVAFPCDPSTVASVLTRVEGRMTQGGGPEISIVPPTHSRS